LNPLKHGVLSQTPVLPLVESAADWERLRNGVFEYLEVSGALEEALADRIAGIVWRMYRVARFESASIDRYLRDVPRDFKLSRKLAKLPTPRKPTHEMVEEMDRMLMERLLPGEETLEKVMRYETKLHRFLLQTLHQFLVLKGLKSPGPGRHWGTPDLEPTGLPDGEHRHPRLPAKAAIGGFLEPGTRNMRKAAGREKHLRASDAPGEGPLVTRPFDKAQDDPSTTAQPFDKAQDDGG
jgi:hypothetical protein